MAKTDSTKGKGAKDGEAKRATSGASPAKGAAKKTTARTTPGSAAGGAGGAGGGGTTGETGATARKTTSRRATPGAGTGGAGEGGATAKTARKAVRSGGAAAGGGGGGGGGLQADLRAFVSARPHGWGHDDWLGLLDSLRGSGHDVSDAESVGRSLERERLAATLERIEGVDATQVQALVDRFGTLWSLRHASLDEIANTPGIGRPLAEHVRGALG